MHKKGRRVILLWQEITHNISMNTKEILGDKMTQRFFIEVYLLAGKLVPIVTIHSLGGSRAYRHHTPNPQSGTAQPTQDEDPQVTCNPLEYLLALCRVKVKNPSQSPQSESKTIITLRLMILATPSHLGGGNHQEKQANSTVKHNHQVPLDAITQVIHLDSLLISQRCWINDGDEWKGFGLAH
jgi:hypothetical protein